jgi:ketosteroid isomerase-like protein
MSDLELARAGLAAWQRGDFETLEDLLAPEATWRAVEPGEWDCESRDDILQTLRERYEEGFTMGPIELVEQTGDRHPPLAPSRGRRARMARGDWDRDHVPRRQGGGHAGPSNPGRRPSGL